MKSLRSPSPRQGGMVLVIALVILVIMTLGTLAMVRSLDTGNRAAGNLSFKQETIAAGDLGSEAAIAWLQSRIGTPTLYQDSPGDGYYATSMDLLDMTGSKHDPNLALVDWDLNSCNGAQAASCVTPSPAIAVNGNTVNYIINRLCAQPLDPNDASNSCANYAASGDLSPKRGELKYGDDKRFGSQPVEYYRITSRVRGPKNTVSFIEAIIHF